MEEQRTIAQQLEDVCAEMCDKYCNFPEQYSNEEWDNMMENDTLPCNDCPLMKLC